jgi:hypothetical protein
LPLLIPSLRGAKRTREDKKNRGEGVAGTVLVWFVLSIIIMDLSAFQWGRREGEARKGDSKEDRLEV